MGSTAMRRREVLVLRYAEAWWLSKRPVEYGEYQHAHNPHINTTTDSEKCLAEAVALYRAPIKRRKKKEAPDAR